MISSPETDRESWLFPDLGSDPDGYPPPGTLTSTAITGWMTCARCWAHDNIQHLPKPTSVHFAIGTTVHHAAELVGKYVLDIADVRQFQQYHQPNLDEILTRSLEVFDREIWKEADRNGTERRPPTQAEAGEAKDIAVRVSKAIIPAIHSLYRQRGLVALEYELPAHLNPFPFPMTGRCDAISGGPKRGNLPLILSDIKTAAQQRRPDQNNRVQGGIYALFVGKADIPPMVLFDTVSKTLKPSLVSYKLGPEGADYMTSSQLQVVYDTVMEVASHISDGYKAYLVGDWRTYYANFPIGQGWNGRHDADHGLPEAHEVA